jgi:hypothetical protein
MKETASARYQKNNISMVAPAPLKSREEEINELSQKRMMVSTRRINCSISEAALHAIKYLKRSSYNNLQFHIELEKEGIRIL